MESTLISQGCAGAGARDVSTEISLVSDCPKKGDSARDPAQVLLGGSGQVLFLSQPWLASGKVIVCRGNCEVPMSGVDYLVGRSGSCVCNPGLWSPLRVQCLPAPQTHIPQWTALPECRAKARKESAQVQICATLPRVRSGWWMPRTPGWRTRKRKTRRKRRPSFLRRPAFSCAWACCCLWLVGGKVADTGCQDCVLSLSTPLERPTSPASFPNEAPQPIRPPLAPAYLSAFANTISSPPGRPPQNSQNSHGAQNPMVKSMASRGHWGESLLGVLVTSADFCQ